MVKPIRIYYEGDSQLRSGFHSFFDSMIIIARKRGVRFQLIAGRDHANTIHDFMTALRTHQNSINLILIDSDRPDDGNLIRELRNHSLWKSDVGAGVEDDQLHFMVQVMEAWFLADRACLRSFYGQNFQETSLPGNPRVEEILKGDVMNSLENATRHTKKGKYDKTRHAPSLLAQINVKKVRDAAPACERLFHKLEEVIS